MFWARSRSLTLSLCSSGRSTSATYDPWKLFEPDLMTATIDTPGTATSRVQTISMRRMLPTLSVIRPMEIVRTRLDDGHHRYARHRHLGIVSRCANLRLVQRHARHVNAGARAIGDVDAVDLNFRVRVRAVIRGARAKAHRAVADIDAIGGDAGCHGEELLQPLTDRDRIKR